MRFYLTAILMAICVTGCQVRDTRHRNPFEPADSGFVLLLVIDPRLVGESERLQDFTNHAIDRYFEDRIGEENDQLIIAQISGDRRSLIWQGTPMGIREEFPDPESFHDMLQAKAHSGTPQVYDGISQALNYVQRNRSVRGGKAQSAALILSSLDEERPDPTAEERLFKELVSYLEKGGLVGFYGLSQDSYFHWDDKFIAAGYGEMVPIGMDIEGRPKLPDFEDIDRPFR